MAIGAIGNAIFVNQMTASVSSVQNAHDNRVNFQNMVAQATVQEKEAEVLEVRPTEENQEVDPDREHQKNEADQETGAFLFLHSARFQNGLPVRGEIIREVPDGGR